MESLVKMYKEDGISSHRSSFSSLSSTVSQQQYNYSIQISNTHHINQQIYYNSQPIFLHISNFLSSPT